MRSQSGRNHCLPDFIRTLLASPPQRGAGLNLWFFRVARLLHPYYSPPEILQLLARATSEQRVKRGEIERAIINSAAKAWRSGDHNVLLVSPIWPALNSEQREAIVMSGLGLVDLWELGPVRFDDNLSHAEEIIDALFPGNPLLCVGQSEHQFATKRREELRGQLAKMQLIVPSPMSNRVGQTLEGKESQHCLENTGTRRFLVIEQDAGSLDEQSAILVHLAECAPLALAVHSGNKSIHGWFVAAGQSEDGLRRFMNYAVSLGADRATWTRSQFVRMPGGIRDNGRQQAVYFFNPRVIR